MVLFALRCFSIKPIQDLRKPHIYGYSRMKEANEYRYFRIEKPYKYGYFGTEKFYKYGYFIVKKFDRDIKGRHGFQILVFADKLL